MALSHQLLFQIQSILSIHCIVGIHPLLVPETFPEAHSETPVSNVQGSTNLNTLWVVQGRSDGEWNKIFEWAEQHQDAQWYILTDNPTTTHRLWLTKRATLLRQFLKGEYILLQKQAWRKGSHKNRVSTRSWELWGVRGHLDFYDISQSLQNMKLSKDGRLGEREWLEEDMKYGPAADLYLDSPLIIATDGSVQLDGCMGAAATSLDDAVPERLRGVGGNPSSTLAELSALQLAADMARERQASKRVTILTDSLTSLSILEDRQRQDFRSIRWHDDEITLTSDKLIQTLNSCVDNGQSIRLQKIKAHALEPLNERADELAERASALPPEELPGEQLRCQLTLPGHSARSWSSSLAKALVQLVARSSLERAATRPAAEASVRFFGSTAVVQQVERNTPKSNRWLLWKRAARDKLGVILRSKKYDKKHKVITQAMTNSYPTQANLYIWQKVPSPACPFGCPENETFAHLQCYCNKMKAQRIAVHHKIWTSILSTVQQCLPHDKYTFVQEASIPKILDAIDTARQPSGDKAVLRQSIGTIDWNADQESPAEQNTAQGVQALSRISNCAVLLPNRKRSSPPLEGQRNKRDRAQPEEGPKLKCITELKAPKSLTAQGGLSHDKFTLVQETSTSKILGVFDTSRQSSGTQEVLLQSAGSDNSKISQESLAEQKDSQGTKAQAGFTSSAVLPSARKRSSPPPERQSGNNDRSKPSESSKLNRTIELKSNSHEVSSLKISDAQATSRQSSGEKEELQKPTSSVGRDASQESPAEQNVAPETQAPSSITDDTVLPSSRKRSSPPMESQRSNSDCSQPSECPKLKRTIELKSNSQEASVLTTIDAPIKSRQSSRKQEVLRKPASSFSRDAYQESPAEQNTAPEIQQPPSSSDGAVPSSTRKRSGSPPESQSSKSDRSQPSESFRLKRTIEPEGNSRWVSVKCPNRRQDSPASSKSSQQFEQKHTQRSRKSANDQPRRRNRNIDRPFFPSLTNPSTANYLSLVNRSLVSSSTAEGGDGVALAITPPPENQQPLPPPDTSRQRPDGVLINWKRRRLHILEFTRPYDSRRTSLAKNNLYKLLKYEPLRRRINNALPTPWTTSVTAFAVGVRGTADEPAWSTALRHLGIRRRHHDQIIKTAISSSLDAIYEMTETRQAALRTGHHSVTNDATPPTVTGSRK